VQVCYRSLEEKQRDNAYLSQDRDRGTGEAGAGSGRWQACRRHIIRMPRNGSLPLPTNREEKARLRRYRKKPAC